MSSPILVVKDLCVTYGKKSRQTHAVQNVSFSLLPGQSLGIVGESGSGKTTIALAMMGLFDNRTTVTGSMTIGEKEYDLAKMKYDEWRAIRGTDIAMVFQDSLASLNPLKRIGEQIAEALYVKKSMSKDKARDEAKVLLKLVEMPDPDTRFRQYPHECSGGMRQRAMIAMALANKPKILICDEPTTALDVTVQAQILETIKRLQDELGMAMILVTHDLGVVSAVTENVSVMYGGKFIETGTTVSVLETPEHPYTEALMKAMPDLDNERGDLFSIPGVPPTLSQEFTWCPFAPRCGYRTQECEESMPPLAQLNSEKTSLNVSDHKVACFHPVNEPVSVGEAR